MLETRVLPLPNIAEAYTVERDDENRMKFELLEGDTFVLYCWDFYDAFQLLFSSEMTDFIKLANKRNEEETEYREFFNQTSHLISDGNSISEQTLSDITEKARSYAFLCGRCDEMKNAMIERVSWNTWIDASRLYETFTGTPREWLS